jgi:hypothetical protein
MNLHAELARLNADPAHVNQLQSLLDQSRDQAAQASVEAARLAQTITQRDAELHAARTKIQALTLELAHLRRMPFGVKSETFSAEQRQPLAVAGGPLQPTTQRQGSSLPRRIQYALLRRPAPDDSGRILGIHRQRSQPVVAIPLSPAFFPVCRIPFGAWRGRRQGGPAERGPFRRVSCTMIPRS